MLDSSLSKNNKVRAILFDFNLVSIQGAHDPIARKNEIQAMKGFNTTNSEPTKTTTTNGLAEDFSSFVAKHAALLNVKLGSEMKPNVPASESKDDLSKLIGSQEQLFNSQIENIKDEEMKASAVDGVQAFKNNEKLKKKNQIDGEVDVRNKYAQALKKKGLGLAGIERINLDKTEQLSKGDSSVHMNARQMALQRDEDKLYGDDGDLRWMVANGVAALCHYLASRGMKMGIITSPKELEEEKVRADMMRFTKQLETFEFHHIGNNPYAMNDNLSVQNKEEIILKSAFDSFLSEDPNFTSVEPKHILVCTSSDSIIKSSRDAGYFTCRIRAPNAIRGEITANYVVETLEQVEDIVNEINGISFTSVRSSGARRIDHGGL